jgi:glycogen(starch) synthase
MEIVLAGRYPPPFTGGNTVHILHLATALLARQEKVTIVDFMGGEKTAHDTRLQLVCLNGGSLRKFFQVRRTARQQGRDAVIHFQLSAMGGFGRFGPILQWCFRRQPMVATIHSGSFVKEMRKSKSRGRLVRILQRFDHLITVSQSQKDYLVELGWNPDRITVVPAFIPEKVDTEKLPEKALDIPANKTTVITSGSLTHLYDYNVLIDAMDRLDAANYHFVFAFYGRNEPDYKTRILSRLAGRDNITVFRDLSAAAYLALIDRCDIYVRPTLTDGDSMAIREALYLGKPVIASDAVWRPEACDLFELQDVDRLAELLLHYRSAGTPKDHNIPTASPVDLIVEVYRKAIEANASQ